MSSQPRAWPSTPSAATTRPASSSRARWPPVASSGSRCSWSGRASSCSRGARRASAPRACRSRSSTRPRPWRWPRRSRRATLKKRSSIQVALERVRDGRADAFFSAGNTAACWTIAKLSLGTLEEVDRPALAAVVPRPDGRTVLLDVGANAQLQGAPPRGVRGHGRASTPGPCYHIGQSARRPDERRRGGEQGQRRSPEVHEVLKGSGLNFVGNVEGRDLFTGRVDVIVMDGFTGNVVLKACEELAELDHPAAPGGAQPHAAQQARRAAVVRERFRRRASASGRLRVRRGAAAGDAGAAA